MEDMVKETVAKGVELHLAGELDLACQLYDAAIKLQPNHADANHNAVTSCLNHWYNGIFFYKAYGAVGED